MKSFQITERSSFYKLGNKHELNPTTTLSLQGIQRTPLVSFHGDKSGVGFDECSKARAGEADFFEDHG